MKDLNQISVELEKLSVKINELSKNMSDVVDALKNGGGGVCHCTLGTKAVYSSTT